MTANDIFNRLLKDDIFNKKYGLTEELLTQQKLHGKSDSDIVEIIKLIVQGVEDGTPDRSIYSQIKAHFNI